MIPGLPENAQGVLKTLLANELEQTKLPDEVKQYRFAQAQGEQRSFTKWKDRNQKGESDTGDIKNYNFYAAQEQAAGRTPLSFSDYGAAARAKAGGPKVLHPNDALVSPDGKELYRSQVPSGATMDADTADFLAERVLAGDSRALIGLGRGAQGAENLGKIQGLVAQKAQARGIDASDVLHNVAVAQGMGAGERTLATQTAKMASASTEAEGAIELGRAASAAVPRTTFVPLNRAIQSVQAGTSSPQLKAFVAANNTIVNTFARAINPTGASTVADKEHAREMLSTADGPDAYNAVLDQLQREIDIAHQAPVKAGKMLEDQRQQKKAYQPGAGGGALTAPVAPQPATAPTPIASPAQRGPAAVSPAIPLNATATNPQTGQKIQFNGTTWVPVGGPRT